MLNVVLCLTRLSEDNATFHESGLQFETRTRRSGAAGRYQSLVQRRARLIENSEGTTQTRATQRAKLLEQ
jgi:hypothetical protein